MCKKMGVMVLMVVLAGLFLRNGRPVLQAADDTAQLTSMSKSIKDITNVNVVSIVEITGVVKMNFMGQSQENTVNARGTVIDATGIVVTCRSALESGPMSFFGGMEIDSSLDPSTLKIVTSDGSQFEAEVVTQDKQLDLTFIKVIASDKKFEVKPLDIANIATAELGDWVVAVSRATKDLDYAPKFDLNIVTADIQKPRKFWMANLEDTGLPVFALDGKLIGFSAMYQKDQEAGETGGGGGGMNISMTGEGMPKKIILPVQDFQNAWTQTQASMAEEKE